MSLLFAKRTARSAIVRRAGFALRRGRVAPAGGLLHGGVQRRGMATEQQLKQRLSSVQNIRKITLAMKMVSAAKLRSVQLRLETTVRPFGQAMEGVWEEDEEKELGKKGAKVLLVGVSADRGLCGGINSSIVKAIRKTLIERQEAGVPAADTKVLLIGDKARPGLARLYGRHFSKTFAECGKAAPLTFDEACLLADHICASDFDEGRLVYNKFRSAIAYDTTEAPILSMSTALENEERWHGTNFEPDQRVVLENLYEYRMALRLFHAMLENRVSEESSRMAAMDNSSKNALDISEALTLQVNRTRQAKITTELTEIISGAMSLKQGEDD